MKIMLRYFSFLILHFSFLTCRPHEQPPTYNTPEAAEAEMLREATDVYLEGDSLLYSK